MDKIEFTILEDGTITTRIGGSISPANHLQADKLLRTIETMAGGEVKREKLAHGHHQEHTHADGHTHKHA